MTTTPLPSTTVVHDTWLLNAPRLDAPILALLSADTSLQLLAQERGFLIVRYDALQGYVPSGTCTPRAENPAPQSRIGQPEALYASPEMPAEPVAILPSETSILCLGKGNTWALVQLRNGHYGFTVTEERSEERSIGCWPSLLAYLAGGGWLFGNWLAIASLLWGLLLPMRFSGIRLSDWLFTGISLVFLLILFVMMRYLRTSFMVYFVFGALSVGLIIGAVAISSILSL